MRLRIVGLTTSAFLFSLLLSGCGINPSDTATTSGTFHVLGNIHGGQQPVTGSTIQLYAANATTNAGPATPLLIAPVVSGPGGFFSLTGDYSCPASNPLIYIVATGGNPGLSGASVNNPALAMMSLLGLCNDLLAAGANQFIFINEFSTVASVQFIASFMTDYADVGSAPNNPAALAGAFKSYTDEVDITTGQYQGGGGELAVTELQVNTLANILAACINTDGSGSPCSTLLSNTSSSDTITAALHMVQSPGTNTATLYNLIPPTPPFQPYFNSVPSDFTTIVGFTLPPNALSAALDSTGHIWIYAGGYSYDTVTNTSTDIPGVITVYDNNFSPLFTIASGTTTPGSGGLYYPTGLAADAHGHVFATNANNTVSEFASDGTAISPAAGWSSGIATVFSPTGPNNGYIDGSADIGPLVIDASNTIFGGTPFGSTNCYFQMNSAGVINTPANGNICASVGSPSLDLATSDGVGGLWLAGTNAIGKADANGNLAVTAPVSQGCFYPRSAVTPPYTEGSFEPETSSLAYDHVHGQLWGKSEVGVGAITDAGVPVFCDYGSAAPFLPLYRSSSTNPGDPYSAGSALMTNGVLDGNGNYFFITGSTATSGVVGSSPNTFTGSATYSTFLGEISPTGAVLTPYNPSTQVYGLQPGGVGTNATATATNAGISPVGNFSAALLGVDIFGNLWAEDLLNNHIIKITGLATANTVNY